MELRRAFNQLLLLLLLPTDIVHYYLYCNQTLTNPFQQVGNCSQEVSSHKEHKLSRNRGRVGSGPCHSRADKQE